MDGVPEMFEHLKATAKAARHVAFPAGTTIVAKSAFDEYMQTVLSEDAYYVALRDIATAATGAIAAGWMGRTKVVLALAIAKAGVRLNVADAVYCVST